jgi:hypothetical protein
MAQFDVHVNPLARARSVMPYVCVMQADVVDAGTDRLVAFVARAATYPSAHQRLFPIIDVLGERYVLLMPSLTSVKRRELGTPVDNVGDRRDAITAAVDLMFLGI